MTPPSLSSDFQFPFEGKPFIKTLTKDPGERLIEFGEGEDPDEESEDPGKHPEWLKRLKQVDPEGFERFKVNDPEGFQRLQESGNTE